MAATVARNKSTYRLMTQFHYGVSVGQHVDMTDTADGQSEVAV